MLLAMLITNLMVKVQTPPALPCGQRLNMVSGLGDP
ncbi:hypothetical protein HNQ96_000720 [Aminobacter lissarensis]|uniref:Uncharacterized protein n=1 Tax=Aminobacter carboxidus TaxID=376165 RepID=A0A8E2BAL7_9HYPH|nr:hypothetical protein [Aminobacter lissarensis]